MNIEEKNVFIIDSNIVSSLGVGTENNYNAVINGKTGLTKDREAYKNYDLPLALISKDVLNAIDREIDNDKYSKLEKIAISCVKGIVDNKNIDLTADDFLLIVSTTKGNVHLLDKVLSGEIDKKKTFLNYSADMIGEYFGVKNKPRVISNACISGVLAVNKASRLIKGGKYKNILVLGVDLISEFIISGFNSFKSLSPEICKPFDIDRDGLNLGEAAAAVLLSSEKTVDDCQFIVRGGSSSNDANHISGPSRDGGGLALAISKAIPKGEKPDYISAHGTSTPYNDDSESMAFASLGFNDVPVNSLKANIGHTLGAAGIIELIISLEAMRNNMVLKTKGYTNFGVKGEITIADSFEKKSIKKLLKSASGFGGCNAAVFIEKI